MFPPGSAISHYEILEPVGKGGMGEVYLARDTKLQRNVALKFLPDSFAADQERLKRFEREARAASALNHPNVAQIYDVVEWEGKHFIVMEFVDGSSLQRLKDDRKQQRPSEIIQIAIQIADALEEAHTMGIIHRDLKPANVMLNKRGQIKVLDFGLAKITQQPSPDASTFDTLTVTEKGIILGTIPYMSPEQALGKTLDHRTDIFSYGTLLYTLLAGVQPFQGETPVETLAKILHENPDPVSKLNADVDPALDRIVRKCQEKEPNSRYQSFREIVIDLKNLKRDIDSTVIQQSRTGNRFWVALVAALIVAVVAIWMIRERQPADTNQTGIRTSLAVLPFHIVTPEKEISYLAIGIPDAIITRLSNLEQIQLRPTSAILAFQNKPFDLEAVRNALNVENILTGTIQKSGPKMRVRVQLIRAKDGVSLWGNTYDVAPSDLMGVEDSVSDQVSSALQIQISPEQKARFKQVPTQNAEAYELYLQGREQLLRYQTDSALKAVSFFEKALALDPSFAKAQASMSQASADIHIRFAPDDQVRYWGERALAEAERALQMNPNLAEAHEARAAVYRKTEFKWHGTIEESDKALKLNSSLYLPYYYKAAAFYHLGLFDLAESELQKAMQVNVSDRVEALRTQAVIDFFRGHFSKTITGLLEVQRLTGKPLADWYLSQSYYYSGQRKEAERVLRELSGTTYAGNAARAKASLAAIFAREGRNEEARQMLSDVLKSPLLDHHTLYSIGTSHVQLGDKEQAVVWLKKSVDSGFPCYPWFEKDPLLDPIRNLPSFQQFLSQLKNEFQKASTRYHSR